MPHGILWTADEDRLLGTMPDHVLAQRLGCSHQKVTARRHKLGIPPFRPARRPWSRAEDELLGTMPDKRLARKLNRSVLAVAERRLDKKIPIFDPQRRRWTPADDKLLHERPDPQIAMFLGISRRAVRHRRRRLGIPEPGGKQFTAPLPWQPAEDALLGTGSDARWRASWGALFTMCAGEGFNWGSSLHSTTGLPKPMRRWGRCRTRQWPGAWVARSKPSRAGAKIGRAHV